MKILKFTGENVKRLKFVKIEPDPNSSAVVLRGKNEQGKSSVLDAIWYALGGKSSIKGEPIRQGETSAFAEVDLGDFIVKRTWTERDSYLSITDPRGAKLSNPQTILDKLMGKLSDPHALARMDKKQQRQIFIDLLGIGDRLKSVDNRLASVIAERQDVNREIKRLQGNYESLADVETDPLAEPVSVASLMEKLGVAEAVQKSNDKIRDKCMDKVADLQHRKKQLDEMKARYSTLAEEYKAGMDELERLDKERKALVDPNLESIRNQIANADSINEKVRTRDAKAKALEALDDTKERYETLGEEKNELEEEKLSILSGADMPIEGLGIDADGITFNDLPIENASDAQRTLIFASIAMAMNPEIKILKITDGSLLDDEHMKKLVQMAEEKGFQLWIESVGTDGTGVIIEDGEVKEAI